MMFGYGSGLGWGLGGWLGMLGMLAVIVGIVVLVVWLVSRATQSAQPQGPGAPGQQPDAMELLRLRFARGEITADEYQAAKNVLEAGR